MGENETASERDAILEFATVNDDVPPPEGCWRSLEINICEGDVIVTKWRGYRRKKMFVKAVLSHDSLVRRYYKIEDGDLQPS